MGRPHPYTDVHTLNPPPSTTRPKPPRSTKQQRHSTTQQAYLLAAAFEEAAKYLALRRLRHARHVTDPRALATYGLCAGAAFGTVENLFIYAFAYGVYMWG